MASTMPDHGRCATHKNYALNCSHYDGLVALASSACQICRFPAERMPQGRLYIDHDGQQGHWAVRGLLCARCNTILGVDRDRARSPEFAEYLCNAWYIGMLADLGHEPKRPDEPPLGALVKFGHHTSPPRRHTKKGWIVEGRWPLGSRTWPDLYRSWGPHRLEVVEWSLPRRMGRR